MGMDMHYAIELRVDGEWHLVGDGLWLSRNPSLFNWLGNMDYHPRPDDPPTICVSDRDFPADASAETRKHTDWHEPPFDYMDVPQDIGHTWHTLAELQAHPDEFADDEDWRNFMVRLVQLGESNEVRVIWWFLY